MKENELTEIIIGEAIFVHKKFGPGLFESVYETVLAYRLREHGLTVTQQQGIPVFFEDIKMDVGFRADLIVNGKVLIEIKSVESLPKVAKMQVLSYLRLTNLNIGLLINFWNSRLIDGIYRVVNNYDEESEE
ncbi:MAG: GxxExxY protein [Chitinophagales bacterium]